MLPPRAVSPMKMRRSDEVDDGISVRYSLPVSTHSLHADIDSDSDHQLEDKYHDAREEVIDLRSEVVELRQRIADLESEPLPVLITATSTASEKDARIAQLIQDNRELQVIAQNVDRESELRTVEKKWERQLERCTVYEEGLVKSLDEERKVSLRRSRGRIQS